MGSVAQMGKAGQGLEMLSSHLSHYLILRHQRATRRHGAALLLECGKQRGVFGWWCGNGWGLSEM